MHNYAAFVRYLSAQCVSSIGQIIKQEIRSMEHVSAQSIAFCMPKQVVVYCGRNLQWCKRFPKYGGGPKILKVGHVTSSQPLLT